MPAILDWRHTADVADTPRRCVICGKPALVVSPRGKPVHKTCAEAWHASRGGEAR